MKSIKFLSIASLTLLVTCGCASTESTESSEELGSAESACTQVTTLKIGALDDPATTTLYGAGVRLAATQMNEALTRLHDNVRFEVAFGDDQGNKAALAKSETLRLLNDEGVLAMVSDSSGDTIQVNRLNYDPSTTAPYPEFRALLTNWA